MTESQRARLEQIFLAAQALSGEARDELLRRECGEDAELRSQVDSLLQAADRSESFFEAFTGRLGVAALMDGAAAAPPDSAQPGDRIGAYQLVSRIATGGMGSVWCAERIDGRFEGRVAIKLLQLRGGAAAARRFELEGSYLARLAHPNIARLLDAGISERGSPYLVIELIDGLPIDAYAERENLSVRMRVELFLDVLHAVQHAHTRLVVHRDIKPSNVMVTNDGQVKLLDFGVAKLLQNQDPDAAGVTREIGLALTPEYAAPEQILGRDVTTATDVFSLGLLLYRLLSGRHAREEVGSDPRSLLEIATRTEPPRLSDAATDTRTLSTEEIRRIALARGATPDALRRSLRGDLDNIVNKALAHEPEDRYLSAGDFAADLKRHLDHELVAAQPPTFTYRIGKFVRRHRGGVTAACLIALVLVGATVTTAWQARAAHVGEQRAASVKNFVASIFRGVDPNALGVSRPRTAVEILQQAERRVDEELEGQPLIQDELRAIIANSYLGLYEAQLAHDALRRALAEFHEGSPEGLRRELQLSLIQALIQLSRLAEAKRHLDEFQSTIDPADSSTDFVKAGILASTIEYQRGDYDAAASHAADALAAAADERVTDAALLAELHGTYGKSAEMQRKFDVALHHNGEALRLAQAAHGVGGEHPQVLELEHNYAATLISLGRIVDAMPHLERSLSAAHSVYGEKSLIASRYAVRLGLAQMERGALRPALELMEFGTRVERELDVGISPATSGRLRTLGRAHLAAREPAKALEAFTQALDVMRRFDSDFMRRILEADVAFARAAHTGALLDAVIELDSIRVSQDGADPRYKTHLPDLYAATLLSWSAEPAAARPYLQRGIELARAQSRTSDLVEGLITLAEVSMSAGEFDGADIALREARDLLAKTQVVETPSLAEVRVGLARVALRRGASDDALALLEQARDFWAGFAPASRGSAVASYWKGEVLWAVGRRDEARKAFADALDMLAASKLPVDRRMYLGAAGRLRGHS